MHAELLPLRNDLKKNDEAEGTDGQRITTGSSHAGAYDLQSNSNVNGGNLKGGQILRLEEISWV